MSPETIAIIAVGVGLGGLMLTLFQLTNRRIDSLERRIDSMQQQQSGFAERLARVEGLIDSLGGRIDSLQQQQSGFAERQSRLEGLIEAIRDMLIRTPTSP